jgi:hypothetical protein
MTSTDESPRSQESASLAQPETQSQPQEATGTSAAESTAAQPATDSATEAPAADSATEAPAAVTAKPVPNPGSMAGPLKTAAPATSFGEVGPDGTVFLRLPDGSQREVGQWAAGDPKEGLEFFARKYNELVTEIDLAAKRLADDRSTPEQASATVERVRKALLEPAFVGDMSALVARIGQLEVLINVKREALSEAKSAAKEASLAQRDRLVAEAESLSDSTAWKVTTERYKQIIDEWKSIPRVDRGKENELWKRFSASRTKFDKARRVHYAELEATRDKAKAAKRALVEQAKELSSSKDWAKTTQAYRDLLDKWKKAGRAGKDDDKLWGQFRAAQDVFFEARNEQYAARNEDETKALAVKEELLTEAEKLVPVKDIKSAKKALHSIQDRWEKAGRVPRNDLRRIEARLRKVEDAVKGAEAHKWKASNPELKGRASDTVLRFRETVEKLGRQLDRAKESGNAAAIAKAEQSLSGAQQMLAVAEQASKKLT